MDHESRFKKLAIIAGILVVIVAAFPFVFEEVQSVTTQIVVPKWNMLKPSEQIAIFGLIMAPFVAYGAYCAFDVTRNLWYELRTRRFRFKPLVETYKGSVSALAFRRSSNYRSSGNAYRFSTTQLCFVPKSASGLFKLHTLRASHKKIIQPVTDSIDNFHDAVQQRIVEYPEAMKAVDKTRTVLAAYKQKPAASFTFVGLGNAKTAKTVGHTGTSSLYVWGNGTTFPEALHRFLVLIHDAPVTNEFKEAEKND